MSATYAQWQELAGVLATLVGHERAHIVAEHVTDEPIRWHLEIGRPDGSRVEITEHEQVLLSGHVSLGYAVALITASGHARKIWTAHAHLTIAGVVREALNMPLETVEL